METALVTLQGALLVLDISAAFDTIDHGILLVQLSELGISGLALVWLCSLMVDHLQRVQFADMTSTQCILNCGVPQGSTILPMVSEATG